MAHMRDSAERSENALLLRDREIVVQTKAELLAFFLHPDESQRFNRATVVWRSTLIVFLYSLHIYDPDLRDEILMESYTVALEKLEEIEFEKMFGAERKVNYSFLYGIVRNKVLQYRQKLQRRRENIGLDTAFHELIPGPEASETLILGVAVSQLNENEWIALLLQYYYDFSVEEIWKILGFCSHSAAESALWRYRDKLRLAIHQQESLEPLEKKKNGRPRKQLVAA
jgi:DNA-directed RNA polymerase specialized sigma24 family protein